MEDLFKTIPTLIRNDDTPEEIRNAVVIAAWRKAAGETLASNAVAVELLEKTLRVAVKDTNWKRHLESLAGQMIFSLNSILRSPAVTYIEFFVDENLVEISAVVPSELTIPEKMFAREAERESTGHVREAALRIPDKDLGKLFLEAAANCLARKRIMEDKGLLEPSK